MPALVDLAAGLGSAAEQALGCQGQWLWFAAEHQGVAVLQCQAKFWVNRLATSAAQAEDLGAESGQVELA